MSEINWLAVVVAAVSSFLLGGLWYSPLLFLSAWTRADGRAGPQQGHPARVFGISFLLAFIAAAVFAWLLGPKPPLETSLVKGLAVGAGCVAACFGINYQFADRKPMLAVIDGGYHAVQFVLFGLVLGLWH